MSEKKYNLLKITNRLLLDEAREQGLEADILDEYNSFLTIQTKQGRINLRSTVTPLSSAPGANIAEEKSTFYRLCALEWIPVPDTHEFDNLGDATEFARKYEHVVVKPSNANHGDGVSVGVQADELEGAVNKAREHSERVVVQQMVAGEDHRLLIVGGRFVAAAMRRPPFVVGDGQRSIRELVDELNSSPLRGEAHEKPQTYINMDEVDDYLRERSLDDVPEEGEQVRLLGTANLSRGGFAENITDRVAPKIIDIAETAASACGLGICGVDIMSEDISDSSKPFYVIEINNSPGIRMHQFPSIGEPINVAKLIIDAVIDTVKKTTIGRAEKITLPEAGISNIPAKIDTGAYRSSVWASDIEERDGTLYFKLLGPESPLYTGQELSTDEFEVVEVENSFGHTEERYSIMMSVRIEGRRVRTNVTLSDRSNKTYPILIGRKLLRGKFVVDVTQGEPIPDEESEDI